MPRVLVLVADPDLSSAVVAALADCGGACAADASSPLLALAPLWERGWDVCVAEAPFAAEAFALRRRRALVILAANPRLIRDAIARTMPPAVILLRIPCSVATLRDAVQLVADESRPANAGAG